jgi:FkbM family methyltransferase
MTPTKLARFLKTALALGTSPAQIWAIFWRQTKNIRVRLGMAAYQPDHIFTLATRLGTVHLRDNFGDVTNLSDLLCNNVYQVARLSAPGAIFDVGGNIGLFSLWATYHNPGRATYCFEPLAANCRMIALNCPAATVVHAGAGRTRGRLQLRVDRHGIMASNMEMPWPTEEQECPVLPLDEYAEEKKIGAVAFLKLDTEGMELEVLDGAAELLRRTDRVAMETHTREKHAGSLERLARAGLKPTREFFGARTGMIFAARG